MIEIPAHAVEQTLIAFVRRWLKLLAAGRGQDACGMIDEPNCFGTTWTPERIQQVVDVTFGPGSRFCTRHSGGFRWSDPDELTDDGHPETYIHNDGSGFALYHAIPLNGEWSDLTVEFEFQRRPQGYAVVLHDLHVL